MFEPLDAKIAIALKKMLAASDFRKNVFIEEQKAHNENRFLQERKKCLHDLCSLQCHRYRQVYSGFL